MGGPLGEAKQEHAPFVGEVANLKATVLSESGNDSVGILRKLEYLYAG